MKASILSGFSFLIAMKATTEGEILPDSTIINYIHREVQQASVMKRRQALRTKEPLKLANTAPITTAPMADWEKKLDTVTKQLAAFTSWRNPPPHLMSGNTSAPNPAPYRDSAFKCYYCFQQNHSSNRCSIF
ncbi:hypothetical protein VP01_5088g1, partial [Puccinia sorghi]